MERLILTLFGDPEPSGWLGRSMSEIAEALDLSEEPVAAALRVVQKRVDPAGLFARNPQECLRLQLEDRGALDDDPVCLPDHLPELETGGVAALVAATGTGELCRCGRGLRCLFTASEFQTKPQTRGALGFSDPSQFQPEGAGTGTRRTRQKPASALLPATFFTPRCAI